MSVLAEMPRSSPEEIAARLRQKIEAEDELRTAAQLALERVEPPADQSTIIRGHQIAIQWGRTWKEELERLPRPPLPSGMAETCTAAEEAVGGVFAPVLSAWRSGPEFAELTRLRAMAADVRQAAVSAADAVTAAEAEYKAAVAGKGSKAVIAAQGKLAACKAQAESAAKHAEAFTAEQLPAAEEAARADLQKRLAAAADAARENAQVKKAALKRELAGLIAARLPDLAVLDKQLARLTPAAQEQRFRRELSELA